MTPTFRIAAIPGDGIGNEVLPEGLRVLHAAAERFGFALDVRHIEWASCDYYAAHGSHDAGGLEGAARSASMRSTSARSAGRRRCPTTSRCGARC